MQSESQGPALRAVQETGDAAQADQAGGGGWWQPAATPQLWDTPSTGNDGPNPGGARLRAVSPNTEPSPPAEETASTASTEDATSVASAEGAGEDGSAADRARATWGAPELASAPPEHWTQREVSEFEAAQAAADADVQAEEASSGWTLKLAPDPTDDEQPTTPRPPRQQSPRPQPPRHRPPARRPVTRRPRTTLRRRWPTSGQRTTRQRGWLTSGRRTSWPRSRRRTRLRRPASSSRTGAASPETGRTRRRVTSPHGASRPRTTMARRHRRRPPHSGPCPGRRTPLRSSRYSSGATSPNNRPPPKTRTGTDSSPVARARVRHRLRSRGRFGARSRVRRGPMRRPTTAGVQATSTAYRNQGRGDSRQPRPVSKVATSRGAGSPGP